ncbi:PilZ domain-containing protein [Veronia nyctiphanis]|uniref:Cyclic diguanosine monophosphate-binding protein n=1 Tax=Veronia nyctiphanis TaxID=1278244 RepID=A0A4Q0YT20_9GAMM|nr:PilZ domain-containing protein [Veronia nyctiphanis]RXJ73833.1 PilZ domain-containing protein [Veronia nyctiphanis]
MRERRKFSRVVYHVEASVCQDENTWISSILDLSLKGALLKKPENWTKTDNTVFDINFCLHDSDIELFMEVTLVNDDDDYLRFLINHVDIDSVSHLKRLIELNVGDHQLLKRELAQLADLKDQV